MSSSWRENALKILPREACEAFRASERYGGSEVDVRDGYIHLSTPEQVSGTLAKFFSPPPSDLVLAKVRLASYRDVRWEPSRGGQLFPHIYGEPMRWDSIVWVKPLEWNAGDGMFSIPEMGDE